MSKRALAAVVLAALVASSGVAGAQELVTRDGDVVRGFVFEGPQETRLNPYGSSAAAMTLGVRRFRTRDVREVRESATRSGFFRQLDALREGDKDGRVRLMRWASARRLKAESARAAAEVLALEPENAEALKLLRGETRWQALRRGNVALDAAYASGLRAVIRMETARARKAAAGRLAERSGVAVPAFQVERMARSLRMDRGVVERVPMQVASEQYPGASYARFVPLDYDPVEPRPLLLALHGGGIMKAEGTPVVGSGKDGLALFLAGARRLGWILICPTAVEAPWGTPRNMEYLDAVLEEVTALWNVDRTRIHVVGHGGGGDGAWMYGGREAATLAGVGVAAAGKPTTATTIVAKGAGLFLYHGEDDHIVPVDPVRKVADRLLKAKADFVYCELPRAGHAFPPEAEADLFRYLAPRRRAHAKQLWPRGSFDAAPSRAEIEAFGEPAGAWGATLPDDATPAALFDVVRAGRLDAEPAAVRLAEIRPSPPEGLGASVSALVKDRDASPFARAWGAWLCGQWRDEGALEALSAVLRASDDPYLLRHAARAAGRIGSGDSVEDLRWALLENARRFRSLKGKTVSYVDYERTCLLGADLAEAIGRVGSAEGLPEDLEESLVIAILRDRRRIIYRRANGEDPGALRARLGEALARCYRALRVEKTLFDMLAATVRKEPMVRQAVARGAREGLPK